MVCFKPAGVLFGKTTKSKRRTLWMGSRMCPEDTEPHFQLCLGFFLPEVAEMKDGVIFAL